MAWGLVDKDVLWTLDKAVYGLRESPKWWGDCRDKTLRGLAWDCGGRNYYLQQCSSDTHLWTIRELGNATQEVLGTLAVYVDDLLLQAPLGGVRDGLLKAMEVRWTLTKEVTLQVGCPLTFLGIEMELRANGDLFLHQRAFIDLILAKHGLSDCNPITSVQMESPPDLHEVPEPKKLKELQL